MCFRFETPIRKPSDVIRAEVKQDYPLSYVYISGDYSGFYWSRSSHREGATMEMWKKAAKLLKRYQRFVNYCEEIAPGWEIVETIHYADNSTAVVEVDKAGNRRNRMTSAPSGDRCF